MNSHGPAQSDYSKTFKIWGHNDLNYGHGTYMLPHLSNLLQFSIGLPATKPRRMLGEHEKGL